MAENPALTATEAADRLAIRELFDSYAHCADRRDAKGQMALFTVDTRFVVYMDSKSPTPSQEFQGREALAPVFDNLNSYEATTHFNGQSRITLNRATATGESYCHAHHVSVKDGRRSLMDRFYQISGCLQKRRWSLAVC